MFFGGLRVGCQTQKDEKRTEEVQLQVMDLDVPDISRVLLKL